MEQFFQIAGSALAYGGIGLICLVGVAISCLGLSGTWLIVGATAIAALYRDGGFPNWWVLAVFIIFSALIELVEFLSSGWGVRRRGGSRLAGVAAVVGGILGIIVGSLIPLPVIGPLFGMLAGSFGLAYLVEYRRLKIHQQASHIATGAVIARILVVLLKVAGSLGMTLILFLGMLLR